MSLSSFYTNLILNSKIQKVRKGQRREKKEGRRQAYHSICSKVSFSYFYITILSSHTKHSTLR